MFSDISEDLGSEEKRRETERRGLRKGGKWEQARRRKRGE
jgi:hypothetical protein